MPDTVAIATRALERALVLLRVLDREHTAADLHSSARAVRHEVESAQDLLSTFGKDITAPRDGIVGKSSPETSQAAARAIRTRSGSQRHRILAELDTGWPELTDFQLQSRLSMNPSSQRPRRLELVEAGYVEAARTITGEPITFQHPRSRQECQAWRITGKGRAALAQLNAGQMALAFAEVTG